MPSNDEPTTEPGDEPGGDPLEPAPRPVRRRWLRIAIPIVATVAIVAPLGYLWQSSRVPDTYSVMDMGYLDYGGGPVPAGGSAGHAGGHPGGASAPGGGVSVTDLVADRHRKPDASFELAVRTADLQIDGRRVSGYTVNGTSPGPTITVRQGQLVQVRVRNESVPAGITMHWHGLTVPNAADGVAGVTQDAIAVGSSFDYRFVASRVGTYWYHSHQVSNPQVLGGLLGALVVLPATDPGTVLDVTAVAHTYNGSRTVNGRAGDLSVPARPGQRVRVRVLNTDNAPMQVWGSGAYRLVAIDGNPVRGATPVQDRALTLTAGARADLELTMPTDGSGLRVQLSKATAVLLGRPGTPVPAPAQPSAELDPLSYGTAPPDLAKLIGFDPAAAVRHFDYDIGRVPGFVEGRPGLWWTINGHLYPDVPMFVVRRGEVATMTIRNTSGEVHPMHLHGHTAIVLSRNGVPASGSPWLVDSLNVEDKESYEIAFLADNPGIWMDHCHNLVHAADGMVAHLMYEGVETPFRLGGAGENEPE